MRRIRAVVVAVAFAAIVAACNGEAVAPPVVFVPADDSLLIAPCEGQYCDDSLLGIYSMHRFYRKIIVTNQIAVVGSHQVEDRSLEVAVGIMEGMIQDRTLWWAFLVEAEAFVAIMSENEVTTDIPEHRFLKDDPSVDWDSRARGLGGTDRIPLTTVGEENLLCLDRDAYRGESILVHEFAHTLHNLVISKIDFDFNSRLDSIFQLATAEGLWASTYARTNAQEYWAEGVQSWFDANQDPQQGIHNEIDTRAELLEYDPRLHALIESWFGETVWTPACPSG